MASKTATNNASQNETSFRYSFALSPEMVLINWRKVAPSNDSDMDIDDPLEKVCFLFNFSQKRKYIFSACNSIFQVINYYITIIKSVFESMLLIICRSGRFTRKTRPKNCNWRSWRFSCYSSKSRS